MSAPTSTATATSYEVVPPTSPPVVPPNATTPPAPPAPSAPIQLPDDHPLVKSLAAQKEQIRELKALASQSAQAGESSKSEAQKLLDRVQALEQERDQARKEAFAAAKGVPVSAISGATPEEWETAAAALLQWRGPVETQRAPSPQEAGAGNQGADIGSKVDLDAKIAEAEKAGNYGLSIALKRQKAAEAAKQKG